MSQFPGAPYPGQLPRPVPPPDQGPKVPAPAPAYDTTNPNWEGTGGTEAQWRARYPVPTDTAPAPMPGPTAPTQPGLDAPTNTQQVLNQAPQSGTPTTVTGAFQQALMSRLNPSPIDQANPAISGAISANRAAEQRGLAQTREALAERAAATGQAGAQESGLRQAIGQSAQRQGQFAGQQVANLAQLQQQQIMQALALGGQMLSEQDRLALQDRLAQLDAQLRREGYSTQSQLGNRELDIRNQLGLGQLELSRLGLAQNESQFGRSLGANLGLNQARLNQDALMALLGGF